MKDLQIVYSKNRRDLAKYMRADIWKHHKNEAFSRGFLIVPETLKANMERSYFSEDTERSLMLEEILSFRRFALRIAELAGGAGYNVVNPALELHLLAQSIQDLEDELQEYASLKNKPNYLSRVIDTIGDLWRYQIKASEIQEISQATAENGDLNLSKKLHDLGLIMESFGEKLKLENFMPGDLLIDSLDENLKILLEKLEAVNYNYKDLEFPWTQYEFLQETTIWIHGFGISRSFTPQEFSILNSLDKLVKEVIISAEADLVPEDQTQIEAGKRQFIAGRQLIFSLINNYVNVKVLELEDQENSQEFEFHAFDKEQNESRFIAGKIKELLFTERDLRPEKIGIALASNEQTLNMKLALDELDIPFYATDVDNVEYKHLSNFLAALIELIKYPDNIENVIKYIKQPYAGLTPDEQDELIEFYRSRGFSGFDAFDASKYSKSFNPGILEFSELSSDEEAEDDNARDIDAENDLESAKDEDQERLEVFELAQRALQNPKSLLGEFYHAQTLREYSQQILEFLRSINLANKVSEKVDSLEAAELSNEAEVEVKVWNSLIKTLSDFMKINSEGELSVEEFIFYLELSLIESNKNRIPANGNQVILGSFKQLANEDLDVVFMVSADSGNIPQRSRKNSLLNSVDRLKINPYLEEPLPELDEQLLNVNISDFYALLNFPSKIIISYTGGKGEEASILSNFRESHGEKLIEHDEPNNLGDLSLSFPERAFTKLKLMNNATDFAGSEKTIVEALKAYINDNHQELNEIWDADNYGREMKKDGSLNISTDLVSRALGKNPLWSISRLEKYMKNPFAFFVEYLLQLKAKNYYKPESSGFGTLVHKVMEISQRAWQKVLENSLDEVSRDLSLEEILNQTDDELIARYLLEAAFEDESLKLYFMPGDAYVARFKAQLSSLQGSIAQIRELIENDINWEPKYSEWSFGKAEKTFSVELSNGENLFIRGFVDRVDINQADQQFRIIDYKTGDKKVSYPNLYYGFDLQLPVYLAAYESLNEPYIAADAGYAIVQNFKKNYSDQALVSIDEFIKEYISKFKLRSLDLEEETLHKLMDHSLEKVREIAEKINSGDFSSAPKTSDKYQDPSRFCDYRAMAQLDRGFIRTEILPKLDEIVKNYDPEIVESFGSRHILSKNSFIYLVENFDDGNFSDK